MDSYMNDDLIYEHLYFIIKTSIKLGGFFYCFIFFNDTFIKSFLPSSFFFWEGGGEGGVQIIVWLLLQILVHAAAGYSLPPSQSFYFLVWLSRRLYCHNININNNNNNNNNKNNTNTTTTTNNNIFGMTEHILLIIMLAINILFTINSLKK